VTAWGKEAALRYGFLTPTGGPREVAELAREVEEAGWDGAFYWDGIAIGEMDTYDPWVVMAAMAMRTERVRIGAMLTPPARRRPWKLARETMTLDHLSGGRLVLPVGLGATDDGGFSKVGEPTDRKTRARRLDEALEILTGLWSGEPFSYEGEHYRLGEMTFRPPTVQRPRVPIWVVGAWPSERSMNRALRYDGVLAATAGGGAGSPGVTPETIREIREYVWEHGKGDDFDIVWEGETPGDDPEAAASIVRPYAEAGATWWIEAPWTPPNASEDLRRRIRQGPPRVDQRPQEAGG
jgi:alkanesulfonate monooxygenase SsuD/methylene tetrahydromethanopterin reductase-like flavin-dependent oxidoreductase (luciferase family)